MVDWCLYGHGGVDIGYLEVVDVGRRGRSEGDRVDGDLLRELRDCIIPFRVTVKALLISSIANSNISSLIKLKGYVPSLRISCK